MAVINRYGRQKDEADEVLRVERMQEWTSSYDGSLGAC